MIRSKILLIAGGGLLLPAVVVAVAAFGQEKPASRAVFAPKEAIEVPMKRVLAQATAPIGYVPKDVIEAPTKRVLAQATAPTGANPKVQPGLVRWHADFAAACAAARTSRKPVLLFQMMGKLDDQFC